MYDGLTNSVWKGLSSKPQTRLSLLLKRFRVDDVGFGVRDFSGLRFMVEFPLQGLGQSI